TPVRLHPFAVVLHASTADEPLVLHTTCDANRATLAFEVHLRRLTEQQTAGELVLVQHDEETRTLLRQPLG
ncbi:MAG TPA: hypothetical protein VEZ12_02685, partial [Herpetosiphonaceae bacterium]|nr:hypothetical protein [Herpetosiphonaceae bacterium]